MSRVAGDSSNATIVETPAFRNPTGFEVNRTIQGLEEPPFPGADYAAGATPTKAEFKEVVDDHARLRMWCLTVWQKLLAAGIVVAAPAEGSG